MLAIHFNSKPDQLHPRAFFEVSKMQRRAPSWSTLALAPSNLNTSHPVQIFAGALACLKEDSEGKEGQDSKEGFHIRRIFGKSRSASQRSSKFVVVLLSKCFGTQVTSFTLAPPTSLLVSFPDHSGSYFKVRVHIRVEPQSTPRCAGSCKRSL